jgi:hypothetical protein
MESKKSFCHNAETRFSPTYFMVKGKPKPKPENKCENIKVRLFFPACSHTPSSTTSFGITSWGTAKLWRRLQVQRQDYSLARLFHCSATEYWLMHFSSVGTTPL